jgi:tRNA pseudouridine32 synthase/23S rRNA pseudouridine746 synthase
MIDFSILFEDGEALVIDKPAGLPLDRPRAGGPCLEDHLDDLRFGFQREPFRSTGSIAIRRAACCWRAIPRR